MRNGETKTWTERLRLKRRVRGAMTVTALLLLGAAADCSTYEESFVLASRAPVGDLRAIGIGFFEHAGTGRTPGARENLYDALAFSLRERGYTPIESTDMLALMQKAEIPRDRELDSNEVLRLSGRYGGNLFVQGRLQEERTETLLEDFVQVTVQVSVHDARTGAKIGNIVLFGRDMPAVTARDTLDMARRVSKTLDKLLVKGRQ